jgi:biopolymer transport protein ExbD
LKFKRPNKYDLIINTAPLVDVVFLLLIFFIITPILENSNRIEINLPKATVEQVESSFQAIEIAIEREGRVFVNGLPISNSNPMILKKELESLSGGDMSLPVVLYADGEVSHQSVVNIMSIIKNIGFEGLQLAIESETVLN